MKRDAFFRHTICLIVAIFSLHTVAPYFAHAQPTSSLKQTASILAPGEKMLVCSADGFRWLTREEIERMPADEHEQSAYKCGLCYVAAHAGTANIISPDIGLDAQLLFRHHLGIAIMRDIAAFSSRTVAHGTRAPPSPIG